MLSFETDGFRAAFAELLAWRRDVRAFSREPLPQPLVEDLLRAMTLAPSVGLSEPWRVVRIASAEARRAVCENFSQCNAEALAGYSGEDAARYAALKLSGLDEAPLVLAMFSDRGAAQGRGLGRRTMPEMLDYSVVAAIHTLWLAARVRGVGLGWVSILDPAALQASLAIPPTWRLIAVLCLGRPASENDVPELERRGWERRRGGLEILER